MPVALALICCAHLFTFSEARQKHTDQRAASAACSAHFEIQLMCAAISRGGCLACVFSASPLSHSRLRKRKQSALLNRARLFISAYQRRMSFGRIRTTAYHNKWGLTHSASMRANSCSLRSVRISCLRLKLSSFFVSPTLIRHRQMNYF